MSPNDENPPLPGTWIPAGLMGGAIAWEAILGFSGINWAILAGMSQIAAMALMEAAIVAAPIALVLWAFGGQQAYEKWQRMEQSEQFKRTNLYGIYGYAKGERESQHHDYADKPESIPQWRIDPETGEIIPHVHPPTEWIPNWRIPRTPGSPGFGGYVYSIGKDKGGAQQFRFRKRR
jgi:hypothetical protein